VEQQQDGGGRWSVTTRKINSTGDTETETFDAVMVCVGIHSMGNMPSFEGQEDYKGKLIHSINYRQARFQNELRISHSYSCLVLCDGRLSNQ